LGTHATDFLSKEGAGAPGAGTGSAYVFKTLRPGKPFSIFLTSAQKAKKPPRALTLEGLVDQRGSPVCALHRVPSPPTAPKNTARRKYRSWVAGVWSLVS